jgi:tetratricopeptide (TPR) repeat protein
MRFLTLLLPVAFLLPSASAQKTNDIILKKDGSRVRGIEITDFLLSGIRGTRGSDPFELPAHQVAEIEWSDMPEEFLSGRGAMARGDFQAAAQLFGAVSSNRPLIKVDAEFFKIKAAVAAIGNDKDAAQTAAEHATSWLEANVNHWRTPEAMLLKGQSQRLAGTAGTAAATLTELYDRSIREGLSAIWSARAKYELAQTLVADGKASEARTQFKQASSAADTAMASDTRDKPELQRLKTLSRVGQGETYLVEKDYSRAESFFAELSRSSDPALKAAGFAGMGQAIFASAETSKDAQTLRRAQVALAQASVSDAASGEASAKANYFLGRCLLALGPEKEGDSFKQRAQSYFQIVFTEYPSTSWASVAKTESDK